MTEQELAIAMKDYFPEDCSLDIAHIVLQYNIVFKIVRPRKVFLGTCYKNKNIITVNANLPPFLFLLVTLHEIGHFISLKKYGTDIKPHGKEWQDEYVKLLKHFLYKGVFPIKLAERVMQEIIRPKATCSKELMEMTANI